MTTVFLGLWVATSYCHTGHLTASGTVPRVGTVAAPRSVPFGTTLEIEGYGVGVVEDRGGAITEGRLDVYYPDCWQARQWGRRRVSVRRLSPQVPQPPEQTGQVTYWDNGALWEVTGWRSAEGVEWDEYRRVA